MSEDNRTPEMKEIEYKVKNQFESGSNSMVLRSRASVSLQEEDASHRDKRQRTSVISSITNCGTFMHIIALTYSWIKLQEKEVDSINSVGLQANLDKVRLMAPTDFFNRSDDYLKIPEPLQDASMCLRCYGITKPKKVDDYDSDVQNKYVTIAHYFAVLTDGKTGVLYNAYGSDLTKNPGYSMAIDLAEFFEFIKAMNSNNQNDGKDVIRNDGYNNYFLSNEIDYFDDDDGCIVKVGDRDEYTTFVLTETDLKIYEIENYQENVQKKLFGLIKAIEQTVIGGKTPKRKPKRKSKRKSKRKKRPRRTRRRKRTKTRRRRKK